MVILLGGSSHVGKTLFAQKLLEELHYPYVSLDHLKMAFIRTGRTHLTVEDDAPMRYFLWPFAAEMIKTAIENGQNLIVEGHGRLLAAKRAGLKEVPVIRLDHLTDEQRRAYALAHNRTAELSAWDIDLLTGGDRFVPSR